MNKNFSIDLLNQSRILVYIQDLQPSEIKQIEYEDTGLITICAGRRNMCALFDSYSLTVIKSLGAISTIKDTPDSVNLFLDEGKISVQNKLNVVIPIVLKIM